MKKEMIDYYAETRRKRLILEQINFILDNSDIPGKLLEDLGLGGPYEN